MEQAKIAADVTSIGIVLTSLADLIPALSALVSLVWICIRVYETRTVQGLLAKWRGKPPPKVQNEDCEG